MTSLVNNYFAYNRLAKDIVLCRWVLCTIAAVSAVWPPAQRSDLRLSGLTSGSANFIISLLRHVVTCIRSSLPLCVVTCDCSLLRQRLRCCLFLQFCCLIIVREITVHMHLCDHSAHVLVWSQCICTCVISVHMYLCDHKNSLLLWYL